MHILRTYNIFSYISMQEALV